MLKSCNEAVAVYGPQNTRSYDGIQVKLCTGQHTAVTKSNIHVSSMSGQACIFFIEFVLKPRKSRITEIFSIVMILKVN